MLEPELIKEYEGLTPMEQLKRIQAVYCAILEKRGKRNRKCLDKLSIDLMHALSRSYLAYAELAAATVDDGDAF